MSKVYDFCSHIRWTGNLSQGNATYKGYAGRWEVATPGKPAIEYSNDPLLGGILRFTILKLCCSMR
jgi:hypothetical protein